MKTNKIKKLLSSLIITITILSVIPLNKANAAIFNDMNGHWASGAVDYLAAMNITSGYPDGTFKPNNTITVQEFLKMVVDAQGYQIPTLQPQDEWLGWATKYAASARVNNLFTDTDFPSSSYFTRPITRYEMARTVARALKDEQYPPVFDDFTAKIKDYNSIPENLKQFVYIAFVKGIITGFPNGEFQGLKNATRAEAAIMVQHLKDIKSRIKTVQYYGSDPQNDYIEPWDLIRKIAAVEVSGDTSKILQYTTKEFRDKYKVYKPSDFTKYGFCMDYFYALEGAKKRGFNKNVTLEIKCKPNYVKPDKIEMTVMEYYVVEGEEYDYNAMDDTSQIRGLCKVDGVWYLDIGFANNLPAYQKFKYEEGK